MRIMGLVVLAGVLGGCTTVKVAQRDGCWVRETKRTLGGTKQDVGPCMRAQPDWADDRLTRLVQECVAQADHRWQVRAVAAWNRGDPLPAQETEESVVALCMSQTAMAAATTNERLAERLEDARNDLAELDRDRASLRAESAQARDHLRAESAKTLDHLRASNDRIAEYLGEAAKRPPPVATATATATSDGTAVTESGLQSETGSTTHAIPVTALPFVSAASPPGDARPPASAQPTPERGVRPPAAERAVTRAQVRKQPVVRATSATPCEVPAATACAVPTDGSAVAGSTGGTPDLVTPAPAAEAPPGASAER